MTKRNIARLDKKRKHEIVGTVIRVKGRVTGQVIGVDYVKDIKNKHMLTYPEAIANDVQALHDAERAGALYCVFTNIDTGIVYRAAIAKIWDAGWLMNLGWGNQQALTLSHWLQSVDPTITSQSEALEYSDPTSTPEAQPLKYKSRAPKGVCFTPGVKQLDFFGGRR